MSDKPRTHIAIGPFERPPAIDRSESSSGPRVSEAMVERACKAHFQWYPAGGDQTDQEAVNEEARKQMRAVLTAALRPDDPETWQGVHRCPECGRVASVPEWVKRPVCVHSWDGASPEVWDGDNAGPDPGRRMEDSPNEKHRTPGPDTWAEMVPVVLPPPASDPEAVERVAKALYEADGYRNPYEGIQETAHPLLPLPYKVMYRRRAEKAIRALLNTPDNEGAE